jgi:hypothetical protein
MAVTGFHSVVASLANRAQMCTGTADCHEENYLSVDCHSQESKFESGLPRNYSSCGSKPQYTLERFAKGVPISVIKNHSIE